MKQSLILLLVFVWTTTQAFSHSVAGPQVESESAGQSEQQEEPQDLEVPEEQEGPPVEEEEEPLVEEQEEPSEEAVEEPSEAEGEVIDSEETTTQESPRQESGSALGMEFRFESIPIATVIDTVMRELGYSYIIDPQVQGTASIYTMGAIPRENAFEVLEQLLQMNGQGIVKQGDLYVVMPLGETTRIPHQFVMSPETGSQARESQDQTAEEPSSEEAPPDLPSQEAPSQAPAQPVEESTQAEPVVSLVPQPEQPSEEESDEQRGVVTYIIPLHHIPSGEMVRIVTAFVSNGANIIDYESANMLIVTDFLENIQQVLKIVNLLDTRYFDVNTVDLIPVLYNQAVDVAGDLDQIFAPGDPAGVRIVAIERLNSILVVTRSASVFEKVKGWIQKLDAPSTSSNIKTFVYQVENNTAMNIASILAQLYQDGQGLPSGGSQEARQGQTQPGPGQAPFGQPQEAGFISRSFQQGFPGGGGGQLGPSLAGRPMSSQSGIRAVVSGNIKIIVNEFNNSLIIQATEADYQFLRQTIRQLDVLPRQVLIEAKIYSVELRDELSFGVAAFLEQRDLSAEAGPATTGEISAPTEGGLGGAFRVTTRTIIGAARQLEATINALRTKTDVQILEAPRILAVDGMQAQINVGAEVPVTTASFGDPLQAGTTSFVNSIQFRPTGTTLLIMPRISASGIVTMDLAIEVSSATGTALTPTINRNFLTTSLIVRDTQTVAIAGIISDQTDISRSRVPVLGDIPIIGALFGQTSRNNRRVELVFFITPYVVRNLPTATELTLEFKRALRSAYDFIQDKETEESELIQRRREEELTTEEADPVDR